ncbi:putative ribonuclease H-like domain-containing protein [Tanacetum coccineum]
MTEFPQLDTGLDVPVFTQGDDPIACLNKAMAFLSTVAASRFPLTNNQLRTSSNLRNPATIQDGRVTVQLVQGRQGQSYCRTGYKGNATSSGINNAGGQERVVKCYNCQGEGHMARQCTQSKRPRNAAWFKNKVILAEAQEFGQILDEEKLAFLADPGILDDVISEVPHFETYHNDMDNQSVHEMQNFKQTPVVDFLDNEITSDSNIIQYSQYLQETQQAIVQDTNLANQEKNNKSLTVELERYKECVKTFEQRLNINLSTREKMIDSQMDDMTRDRLALQQQIDSLEQNLSN